MNRQQAICNVSGDVAGSQKEMCAFFIAKVLSHSVAHAED